jgi:molybdopterin converting factor small subunit
MPFFILSRAKLVTVYVKLLGSLLPLVHSNPSGQVQISLREDSTVGEAIRELSIPAEQVKLVLVNHTGAELNQPLKEGDHVSLFPPEYPVFADWQGSILGKSRER